MSQLNHRYGSDNIHFIDGFPIPVCAYTRARGHKNFKEHVFSYCAAKQEKNIMGLKVISSLIFQE